MNRSILALLSATSLLTLATACADAGSPQVETEVAAQAQAVQVAEALTPPPETQTEFTVDPNSVAGDFQGVTGTVERLDILADGIRQRPVDVWLPPSYSGNPDRRYPVLYMHDGQNLFEPGTSYAGWDWGVDEALTAMGQDVIVVGVHNIPEVRLADYFPEKAKETHGEVLESYFPDFDFDSLTADEYLAYLVSAVKPAIDARYRTRPEKAHTSIMGSSMGGLISLYAISEYPDVYGAAGMVSTHWPIADGVLVDFFAERLPDPETHRLYFDFGTNTLDWNYERYQDEMDVAIEAAGYQRGVNWTTRKFDGHDHSERSWRSRVDVPLRFLLNGEDVEGGERR